MTIKTHWHDYNPWKATLVYVSEGGFPLNDNYKGHAKRVYGPFLDYYLLNNNGHFSAGIRFSKEEAGYLSPYLNAGNQELAQKVWDKYNNKESDIMDKTISFELQTTIRANVTKLTQGERIALLDVILGQMNDTTMAEYMYKQSKWTGVFKQIDRQRQIDNKTPF